MHNYRWGWGGQSLNAFLMSSKLWQMFTVRLSADVKPPDPPVVSVFLSQHSSDSNVSTCSSLQEQPYFKAWGQTQHPSACFEGGFALEICNILRILFQTTPLPPNAGVFAGKASV